MKFCDTNCCSFPHIRIFVFQTFPQRLAQIFCDLVHADTTHCTHSQCSNQGIWVITVLKHESFCVHGKNIFLAKQPCFKAGHASFWTRKICLCVRPPKKTWQTCTRNTFRVLAKKWRPWREIKFNNILRTQGNKTCQGKLVNRAHEKVNLSRKLVRQNLSTVHTRKSTYQGNLSGKTCSFAQGFSQPASQSTWTFTSGLEFYRGNRGRERTKCCVSLRQRRQFFAV